MDIDQDKLQEFLGKFGTDLGASIAAGSVVVGTGWACTAAWPRLGDRGAVGSAYRDRPALRHGMATRAGRERVRPRAGFLLDTVCTQILPCRSRSTCTTTGRWPGCYSRDSGRVESVTNQVTTASGNHRRRAT